MTKMLRITPVPVINALLFAVASVVTFPEFCFGNDPRPSSDTPFRVEPQPYMSRRAKRKARRRGTYIEFKTFENQNDSLITSQSPDVHKDQPYHDDCLPCQHFDIYLPQGCHSELPLIIWIHGTTWRNGTRDDCPITWLTNEGYAVASIGYRLSSEATFPAQVYDCLSAITFLEEQAEVWGIDPNKMCIAGASAGGHLAALSGLWNESIPNKPMPRVASICIFGAPTHLTTLGPEHDRSTSPASLLIGGPLPEFREAAQRASPLVHVNPDAPPILIVHGTNDKKVAPEQSKDFNSALEAAGIESYLVFVDAPHELPLNRSDEAGQALLSFLRQTLNPALHAR